MDKKEIQEIAGRQIENAVKKVESEQLNTGIIAILGNEHEEPSEYKRLSDMTAARQFMESCDSFEYCFLALTYSDVLIRYWKKRNVLGPDYWSQESIVYGDIIYINT